MTSAPASTPTVDHTLIDADGRHVAWAEWGDPQGSTSFLGRATSCRWRTVEQSSMPRQLPEQGGKFATTPTLSVRYEAKRRS
jgi:hypothetical protein